MSSTSDDENAQLRVELDRANERAQALKKELDAFVYATSHDLKSPLRSIGSYSQLLVRLCCDVEGAADYAKHITDGVTTLTALVDQLLNLSRAGSSADRQMVNLASIVQAVEFKMQDRLQRSGARISCTGLPEIPVNQIDFERLFENLIDNAIKYRSGETPRIEISAQESDAGYVISVRDNGQGIAPDFHKQVFVAFKRLHGTEIPGSGLGLSVCRKIVEAHDGRIWVESEGSGGSVFKINLPY
ncbi:MAG: ATP-binding protein [Acidobacteriota bacterium]|nr:ATP-binding protein [Acidobacteriota bacterium]